MSRQQTTYQIPVPAQRSDRPQAPRPQIPRPEALHRQTPPQWAPLTDWHEPVSPWPAMPAPRSQWSQPRVVLIALALVIVVISGIVVSLTSEGSAHEAGTTPTGLGSSSRP